MKIQSSTILFLITVGLSLIGCATKHFPIAGPSPGRETTDLIVVDKSERKLTLFKDAKAIRTYRIALGGEPVGPKTKDGDHKTPEGDFCISGRLGEDKSAFHLALKVSYPYVDCEEQIKAKGLSEKNPGSAIRVHGIGNGWGWAGPLHRIRDWTDGCMAVTNSEIEEIWNLVPNRTPIKINP